MQLMPMLYRLYFLFFFLLDAAPTDIYTLSLHDALPIFAIDGFAEFHVYALPDIHLAAGHLALQFRELQVSLPVFRSEEHTSELQSLTKLVCRLLLEKKKTNPKRCRTSNNYAKPPTKTTI